MLSTLHLIQYRSEYRLTAGSLSTVVATHQSPQSDIALPIIGCSRFNATRPVAGQHSIFARGIEEGRIKSMNQKLLAMDIENHLKRGLSEGFGRVTVLGINFRTVNVTNTSFRLAALAPQWCLACLAAVNVSVVALFTIVTCKQTHTDIRSSPLNHQIRRFTPKFISISSHVPISDGATDFHVDPGSSSRVISDRAMNFNGATVVGLLASHQGRPGSVPGGVTPGFSHEGIAPDDRWSAGFLEDLPFPPPLNSGAASYSPRFALIGSEDFDVTSRQISSLTAYLLQDALSVFEFTSQRPLHGFRDEMWPEWQRNSVRGERKYPQITRTAISNVRHITHTLCGAGTKYCTQLVVKLRTGKSTTQLQWDGGRLLAFYRSADWNLFPAEVFARWILMRRNFAVCFFLGVLPCLPTLRSVIVPSSPVSPTSALKAAAVSATVNAIPLRFTLKSKYSRVRELFFIVMFSLGWSIPRRDKGRVCSSVGEIGVLMFDDWPWRGLDDDLCSIACRWGVGGSRQRVARGGTNKSRRMTAGGLPLSVSHCPSSVLRNNTTEYANGDLVDLHVQYILVRVGDIFAVLLAVWPFHASTVQWVREEGPRSLNASRPRINAYVGQTRSPNLALTHIPQGAYETLALRKLSVIRCVLPLTSRSVIESGNLSRPPPAYGINHCQHESNPGVGQRSMATNKSAVNKSRLIIAHAANDSLNAGVAGNTSATAR
ncbi:hypothetical protein PR048_010514 [Dryococelus australis]|uniref:Uncharacterized protein n=1 Tax=Dryococelus australis TaxID=614101 RepID=A0ABQ9I2Y4_9NEOP|nr:hypothetical protein PR048_010514 [Dryococelus australis]